MTAKASRVRSPAVAGTFYPDDPVELAETVDRLLAAAGRLAGPSPRAVVVPHAGYAYSGPVAASAYALLRADPPSRVALVGPAHFVPFGGFAVPTVDAWATPLGDVPIDRASRETAIDAGAIADDAPDRGEHSLEVQLPFLQRVAGPGLTALPVTVGDAAPGEVADVLEAVGPAADLVVVSTDLSHDLDARTAATLDRRTADAIVRLAQDGIPPRAACGATPLGGALVWAARRGLVATELDLRTSADTTGDARRVVGYGAFAFERVAT